MERFSASAIVPIMGASCWHARVSYQDDIGAALRLARQDAYDRGDYYRQEPNERARSMSEEDYVTWAVAEFGASGTEDWELDEFREEWRAAIGEVTGPDSLLRSQPYSGTHSVIDMVRVSDESDYSTVSPAPTEELLELFGTIRPAAADVEAAIGQGSLDGFARWHGKYVIAFDGDEPKEIFFVGWSGD